MRRIQVALILALLPGCTGSLLAPSGPAPSLYELTAPRQIDTAVAQAKWQLLVDAPSATLDLDSSRIALAPAPARIDYYANVAWIDRAPKMLQELIVEAFDRSGQIAAVQRQGGGLSGDFALASDLRDFQVDAAPDSAAHIRITGRLVRMRDRSIVASHTFEASAPVGASGIDPVVAAFDRALAELLPQIVTWTLTEGSRNP